MKDNKDIILTGTEADKAIDYICTASKYPVQIDLKNIDLDNNLLTIKFGYFDSLDEKYINKKHEVPFKEITMKVPFEYSISDNEYVVTASLGNWSKKINLDSNLSIDLLSKIGELIEDKLDDVKELYT